MPRHCAHHHEDHNPSKKEHIKSPIPGMLDSSEPLSDWLPELWEKGEEPDYHLFGCPDCDGLGQVSPSITMMDNDDDADNQIYQAIAWMWVHRDPIPKMDDLNRAGLDRVVQSLIAMRFSIEDMYRLAASYMPATQEQTINDNEEWAWIQLRSRMTKKQD